jgi:hypothetical protein
MTNTLEQEIAEVIESWTPVPTYVAKFRDIILSANLSQMEAAAMWYAEAQEVAEDVAENMGTTLEIGASIVSAFSPRERWASNVAKALAFSMNKPVAGLPNNLRMAQNAMVIGFDALKGLKTNAFARAIAGDTNAVVIDVWMMRAANMPTDSPNKGQYRELSEAVTIVAGEFGISPRTAQALIWIIVRGKAS